MPKQVAVAFSLPEIANISIVLPLSSTTRQTSLNLIPLIIRSAVHISLLLLHCLADSKPAKLVLLSGLQSGKSQVPQIIPSSV